MASVAIFTAETNGNIQTADIAITGGGVLQIDGAQGGARLELYFKELGGDALPNVAVYDSNGVSQPLDLTVLPAGFLVGKLSGGKNVDLNVKLVS